MVATYEQGRRGKRRIEIADMKTRRALAAKTKINL
jgi:hypothetical protein